MIGCWRRRSAAGVRASECLGWGKAAGVKGMSWPLKAYLSLKGSQRFFVLSSKTFVPLALYFFTGKSDLILSTLAASASPTSKLCQMGQLGVHTVVSCAIQFRHLPLESFIY